MLAFCEKTEYHLDMFSVFWHDGGSSDHMNLQNSLKPAMKFDFITPFSPWKIKFLQTSVSEAFPLWEESNSRGYTVDIFLAWQQSNLKILNVDAKYCLSAAFKSLDWLNPGIIQAYSVVNDPHENCMNIIKPKAWTLSFPRWEKLPLGSRHGNCGHSLPERARRNSQWIVCSGFGASWHTPYSSSLSVLLSSLLLESVIWKAQGKYRGYSHFYFFCCRHVPQWNMLWLKKYRCWNFLSPAQFCCAVPSLRNASTKTLVWPITKNTKQHVPSKCTYY